jgi:hypothetical protein
MIVPRLIVFLMVLPLANAGAGPLRFSLLHPGFSLDTKFRPEHATWSTLKRALLEPTGADYFEMGMKNALIPPLIGKVLKLEPAVNPRTILVVLETGRDDVPTADATLKFDSSLPGKVETGTELTFEGVAVSFTTDPFMLVFEVARENLHGWTGKATGSRK